MANQGTGYNSQQDLQLALAQRERNHLESSVRHCALFFIFSGISIMFSMVGASSLNWEHVFVGFLLFVLGLVLWLLHAFLLNRSPTAMMVASVVVRAFHKLFLARD